MSVSNYLIPDNLTNNSNLYVNNLYATNINNGLIKYYRQLLPYNSPSLLTTNYYNLIGPIGVGSLIIPFDDYKTVGSTFLITNSGLVITANATTVITIRLSITNNTSVVANFTIPASATLTNFKAYEAKIKLIFYDINYTSQPPSVAVGVVGYLNIGSNNLSYINSVQYLLLTSVVFQFNIEISFSTISPINQYISLSTIMEKI